MGCYYSRLIEPRNPHALEFNAAINNVTSSTLSFWTYSIQVIQSYKCSREFDVDKFCTSKNTYVST